jgi:putative SOS response-associated peptidase YedK
MVKEPKEKISAEAILSIHPSIRVVVLSTVNGDVLFTQARQGLPPEMPEEAVRNVMNMRAEYLTEITKRTNHIAGKVKRILTSYDNFDELIVVSGDRFLSITLEPDMNQQLIGEITAKAQETLNGASN